MPLGFVDGRLDEDVEALDRVALRVSKLTKYMRGVAIDEVEVRQVKDDGIARGLGDPVGDPSEKLRILAKHLAADP